MRPDRLDLIDKQMRLILAVKRGRSDRWCLRLWSRFIKARDGHQCIVCSSDDRTQAHHIFRRSVYPHGWYQPGNGITLCHECHERQHSTFNGRPNLSLPMDAEGGDNLDDALRYFDCLISSANTRGHDHDELYYLDDHMLLFFMRLQQCEHMRKFLECGQYSRLRIIGLARELIDDLPPRFQGMEVLKFQQLARPGDQLHLTLRFDRERSKLHFAYRNGDAPCSSGRILLGESS